MEEGEYKCVCIEGWAGSDCSIPLEMNCKDNKDNDDGECPDFEKFTPDIFNTFTTSATANVVGEERKILVGNFATRNYAKHPSEAVGNWVIRIQFEWPSTYSHYSPTHSPTHPHRGSGGGNVEFVTVPLVWHLKSVNWGIPHPSAALRKEPST